MSTEFDDIPKPGKMSIFGDSLDLDRFLVNSYEDIGQASMELPAVIEWINIKLQRVIESKVIAKQAVNEARAKAFVALKNGGWKVHVPEARPTDSVISELIELDPHVTAAVEEFAILSGWSIRLTNMIYAFQTKLELVRSTETTRRGFIPRSRSDDED